MKYKIKNEIIEAIKYFQRFLHFSRHYSCLFFYFNCFRFKEFRLCVCVCFGTSAYVLFRYFLVCVVFLVALPMFCIDIFLCVCVCVLVLVPLPTFCIGILLCVCMVFLFLVVLPTFCIDIFLCVCMYVCMCLFWYLCLRFV